MTRLKTRYGRLAVGAVVLTGTVLAQMPPTLRVVGLVVNGADMRRRTTPLVVTSATVRVRPFGVATLFGAAPPNRYRLGERRWIDRTSGWRSYPGPTTEIHYTFQDQRTRGRRLLYYQVRSTNPRTGVVTFSNIASATLDFRPPDPRRVGPLAGYAVNPDEAYTFAKTHGFTFAARPTTANQNGWTPNCRVQTTDPDRSRRHVLVLMGAPLPGTPPLVPQYCTFWLFFGRRLAPGWRVKAWQTVACRGPVGGCDGKVKKLPSGDDLSTVVDTRNDGYPEISGSHSQFVGSFWFELTRLTLIGPTGADWHDAFR